MSIAIKIENVSKLYRLGTVGTGTIAHDLNRWWHQIRGKEDPYAKVGQVNDRTKKSSVVSGQSSETAAAGNCQLPTDDSQPATRNSGEAGPDYVWALRDINLEVQQGEILGIIGRNGAGKSTLLKLLSRVTAPTSGTIKTKGRIASLLEVGTGFHHELTGRENIYLNGAILGMRRHEITQRLDEIVEFSGCAKYLDTPVKRYSSGMTVRLGFAVAAHLDCEILIVDEVLAVGDAEFQKSCLAKMHGVATSGRTVLFVSHNMQAVRQLCDKAVLMHSGTIQTPGTTDLIVARHLGFGSNSQRSYCWNAADAPGDNLARLYSMELIGAAGDPKSTFLTEESITVKLSVHLSRVDSMLCIGFDLIDRFGNTVFRSYTNDDRIDRWPSLVEGIQALTCEIPCGLLNAGLYSVQPRIGLHNSRWIVHLEEGPAFTAEISHGTSPFWNCLQQGSRPGSIAPILQWKVVASVNGEYSS
jgi:lipopolysaccharide transport system ATP-binding protein